MPKREPLALSMVIPDTGIPISFSGGQGDEGTLKLKFYASGDEIQRLLELRGTPLIVVLQEEEL